MISKMEPKTYNELSLINGFILSTDFVAQIRSIWKIEKIPILPLRKISEWSIDFFDNYQTAPKDQILDYLESDESLSETDINTLRKIIDIVIEKTESVNVDYLIEKATKYIHQRTLIDLAANVKTRAQHGDLTEAEQVISTHLEPSAISTGLEDALGTKEQWQKAFESKLEPLFTLKGALGKMINEHLEREGFLALLGRFGSGKTWWLIELAYQAYRSRLNVVYFSVGDMSKNQVRRRIGMRIKQKSDLDKFCGRLLIPVLDCIHNQKGTCNKKERTCNCKIKCTGIPTKLHWNDQEEGYIPCTNCKDCTPSVWYRLREPVQALTWSEAYKTAERILTWTNGRAFKLGAFPSDRLSVRDIECILDQEESRNGFVPDVIVIDYADVLRSSSMFKEHRHQIDETWKRLRGIAQERKCLVITATQADAQSYDAKLMKPRNFSESRTKLDHVTAFFGLNKTTEDNNRGIQRINALKLREDECEITHCVNVLQCLNIAKPFIDSF